MQIFYEPEILTNGGILNEEESKHCVKVLRHKAGDTIHVINGTGIRAVCTITDPSPRACRVNIDSTETGHPHLQKCHIAIAPTKSIDRFEWFLEKSTELGTDQITPLLCHQSERKQIKLPRLQRVITAATKQSLRLWQPVIHQMTSVHEFMNATHPEKKKYIAHCDEKDRKDFVEEINKAGKEEDFLILIGPEGDFTETEIKTAVQKGFIPVSLGKTRLRTETAGIFASAAIKILREHHK